MLSRYYPANKLIIVPTTALVHQMASDFEDYGYEGKVHKITAGEDKDSFSEITVTTWQSMMRMSKDFGNEFGMVIGDEAHLFAAKSLSKIMESLTEVKKSYNWSNSRHGGPKRVVREDLR